MEELASFSVVAETDIVVMKLSAELGHVVALNMLLFQQLVLGVGVRAVRAEFAFSKVNDILAHFSLSLHLNSLVEFLSFLDVCEILLLLLPCGFAVSVVFLHGIRSLIDSSFFEEFII